MVAEFQNQSISLRRDVYIASGKAIAAKGRYFDCEQNMAQVVAAGRSEIVGSELYSLKVEFLGGLPNNGGTSNNLKLEV
jgi:hypothetical protein